jgi:hypothetical protein
MTWLVRSVAAQLLDHLGQTMKIVVPVVLVALALMTILDPAKWIFGQLCGQLIEFSGLDRNQAGLSGTCHRLHRIPGCREPDQNGGGFYEH